MDCFKEKETWCSGQNLYGTLSKASRTQSGIQDIVVFFQYFPADYYWGAISETGAPPGMASSPTHCLGSIWLWLLLRCQLKTRCCSDVHNSSYAPVLNLVFNQESSSVHWYSYPAGEEHDIGEWGGGAGEGKIKMFCHSFISIPRLRDLKSNPHTHSLQADQ